MERVQTKNPFWERVAPLVLVSQYNYDAIINQFQQRNTFCHAYSWAIADPDSVTFVAEHVGSHVVEMGAGMGYWAWQLAQYGIDVLAYDTDPPDDGYNFFHNRENTPNIDVFHPIRRGTPDILSQYADRTLFLCWPPYNDDMAYQCLLHYTGNRVVYIGESEGGCNGDDAFFHKLEEQWEERASYDIIQWSGIHDAIIVYERKYQEGQDVTYGMENSTEGWLLSNLVNSQRPMDH